MLIAAGGSGLAFALDAATFAVSAGCPLLMRTPARALSEMSESPETSVWQEFKEGMDHVRGNVWLWGTFVAATFAYLLFIGPTEVLLPFVVKNELHGTAGDFGLVLASGGIGAIAAALIVGQRGAPQQYMRFIYVSWTLATLAVELAVTT